MEYLRKMIKQNWIYGVDEMTTCDKCKCFKEKITETKFGVWFGKCKKNKINRNPDSDSCMKIEPTESTEFKGFNGDVIQDFDSTVNE